MLHYVLHKTRRWQQNASDCMRDYSWNLSLIISYTKKTEGMWKKSSLRYWMMNFTALLLIETWKGGSCLCLWSGLLYSLIYIENWFINDVDAFSSNQVSQKDFSVERQVSFLIIFFLCNDRGNLWGHFIVQTLLACCEMYSLPVKQAGSVLEVLSYLLTRSP